MQSVKEVIVVEGRYDKNTLLQVVDAVVIETGGFGIFNDKQKQKLLRSMAEKRGLIILTDPDGAGFVIRNFIKACVPAERLKQAYVPDIHGKEKEKPGRPKKESLAWRECAARSCLRRSSVPERRFQTRKRPIFRRRSQRRICTGSAFPDARRARRSAQR